MSINKVTITGNLTRDPENRATSSGTMVMRLGVAVNDRRFNQETQQYEDVPNFVDCVMFGRRAEALGQYLHKGMKVAIAGRLRWSSWEKDGIKRSKLEVVIDDLDFLSSRTQASTPKSTLSEETLEVPSVDVPLEETITEENSTYDSDIPF